jgi:hypothetical protein
MMQQLATGQLTSGDNSSNFTRYSELASVQQNYLQQMGALWVNRALGSGPMQPAKGDGGSQARSGRKGDINRERRRNSNTIALDLKSGARR